MQSFERRLPIYLLLDCSESMVGEPLDAVNQGLALLCSDLRSDPVAIETAWLSLITFAGKAQACPLTDVLKFSPPSLTVSPGTSLGAAFELLAQCLQKEVRKSTPMQKGDWKPIVFLLTDGMPTDDWQKGWQRFNAASSSLPVNLIAIGCGEDADSEVLRKVTPSVLLMKSMSSGDFKAFFKWVSSSVRTASVEIATQGRPVNLPAPPADTFTAPETGAKSTAAKSPMQVFLAARCREHKKGYLMRYRRAAASADKYVAEKAYSVGDDYFAEAAASPVGRTLDSSKLSGAPNCPHCGRPGWTLAPDKSSLICSDKLEMGGRSAQVMFVLDVTGSMSGEIEGVKDNIKDFMDYIQSEGLAVEAGLIAFRDLEVDEPPEVFKFKGQPFTNNSADFKTKVSKLSANGGGGNEGESSLDALALACRQPFKEDVARILILITDEPPLIPDGSVHSMEDIIKAMGKAGIQQLHLVVSDYLSDTYAPLQREVRGKTFKLDDSERGGKSFRKVLLDIGRSISVTTRLG